MSFEALGVTISIHLEVRLPIAPLTNHTPHQRRLELAILHTECHTAMSGSWGPTGMRTDADI